MNVILLEKTGRLGTLGDRVQVKPGYARNYLIPYGKAVMATKSNIEKFEARRAELEQKAAEKLRAAQTRAESLNGTTIKVVARASEEGRLYGSVGTREIAAAISKQGVEVRKSEILLPDGALHNVGEFQINLQLHSDITVTVNIIVVPEA